MGAKRCLSGFSSRPEPGSDARLRAQPWPIKPRVIQDFLQKGRSRLEPGEELTIEKIEEAQQTVLFDVESELVKQSRTSPEPLPWIGYKFTCQGTECLGHEMMCIDWEIQQLFRRYRDKGTDGFQKVGESNALDEPEGRLFRCGHDMARCKLDDHRFVLPSKASST